MVVRSAFVVQYAEVRPQRAMAAWSGHPEAELWSGLTDIASATRSGRPVPADVLQRINRAATKAPLAPEPFLVRGVQAQLAGNEPLAARAFEAAELRDGRSVPARYFLADHYLRTGDAARGLREIAVLARMIPNGVASLSPFVATYAKDRRNWPQLRALFRSDPQLEDAALGTLATDPSNADIVLQLATPRPAGPPPVWTERLVAGLVTAGSYDKAYAVWRAAAHPNGARGSLIYDPGFSDASAPGPFNWTLTSSTLGLAERQKAGRLHVVYYGQDDGVLASQLLLLKPGHYRLAMQITGDFKNAASLAWTVTCANSKTQLLNLRLAASTQGAFDVPANCPAQRLELSGSAPELPQTVDLTIGALTLVQEQSR